MIIITYNHITIGLLYNVVVIMYKQTLQHTCTCMHLLTPTMAVLTRCGVRFSTRRTLRMEFLLFLVYIQVVVKFFATFRRPLALGDRGHDHPATGAAAAAAATFCETALTFATSRRRVEDITYHERGLLLLSDSSHRGTAPLHVAAGERSHYLVPANINNH